LPAFRPPYRASVIETGKRRETSTGSGACAGGGPRFFRSAIDKSPPPGDRCRLPCACRCCTATRLALCLHAREGPTPKAIDEQTVSGAPLIEARHSTLIAE